MKKSILMITVLLALPMTVLAQDGNASLYTNEAGISGGENSAFGEKAGASSTAKGNVYLGFNSGVNNRDGEGNIFIGRYSGLTETGGNLLYIENSNSKEPLIWGDFKSDIVNINGRLGVQTINPASLLSVGGTGEYGSLSVTGQATGHIVNFRDNLGENVFQINGRLKDGNMRVKIGDFDEIGGTHHLIVSDKQSYFLNGNVGIGTKTPDERLAVNGKIHAQEVRVDLNGWPDYVFDNDYNLPSLKEVEEHIKLKGHLQNIPSSIAVQENGIELGDMNSRLLQKIEELTLYTIQQQKELNLQKDKNNTLEKRLEKLEKLIQN